METFFVPEYQFENIVSRSKNVKGTLSLAREARVRGDYKNGKADVVINHIFRFDYITKAALFHSNHEFMWDQYNSKSERDLHVQTEFDLPSDWTPYLVNLKPWK